MAFRALDRLRKIERQIGRFQEWQAEHAIASSLQAEAEQGPSTELPGLGDVPLLDLIPRLSPGFAPPYHLGPLVDELEQVIAPRQGQRFYWFSVPPRHYKTTTLLHGAVKHLLRWPDQGIAYVSHSQPFASKQSKDLRKLCARAGFRFTRGSNRQDEWEVEEGGGLVARGIGAVEAGRGYRLILVDDPIGGHDDAFSAAKREAIFDALEDDVLTRLSPDGAVILVHTRWHPDDPIGRYQRGHNRWRGLNIPALSGTEESEPLLPEVWGFDFLDGIRRSNVYKFDSLYQGRPRSKGTKRFNEEPARYQFSELPRSGYRVAYGVDLASTAKTQADFSVCLKLVQHGHDTEGRPLYYVADLVRKQVDAPSFTLAMHTLHAHEPAPMLWLCSGTEKGTAQFVQQKIKSFKFRLTTVDKFQRSEAVSEAWNQGRVLVPSGDDRPEWVDDFLDEVTNFTGQPSSTRLHDDQVDALGGAFAALNRPERDLGIGVSSGSPRIV